MRRYVLSAVRCCQDVLHWAESELLIESKQYEGSKGDGPLVPSPQLARTVKVTEATYSKYTQQILHMNTVR